MTSIKTFDFTDKELTYLKQRVDYIDRNGMFSAETIDTYTKIIDEPLVEIDDNISAPLNNEVTSYKESSI